MELMRKLNQQVFQGIIARLKELSEVVNIFHENRSINILGSYSKQDF